MDLQTEHCFLKQMKEEPQSIGNFVSECESYPLSTGESLKNQQFSYSIFWAVRVRNSEHYIGLIGLHQSSTQFYYDLSVRLLSHQVNTCMIEEALGEIINYGFEVLKASCIQAKISTIQYETSQLLCRVGMRLEEKIYGDDEVYSIYFIGNPHLVTSSKMRTSHEVLAQVISFVEAKESIRALIQTGLRLDVHAPIDLMRDYHFNWYIKDKEMESFIKDQKWIWQFGEVIIFKETNLKSQGHLFQIQYKDGVRLDIQLVSMKDYLNVIYDETLSKVLLDKDRELPPLDEPNNSGHYIQIPTEEMFNDVLNDLWWYQIEVAKAIYRDELPLAKWVYDGILMQRLLLLLSWKIGYHHEWKINIGRRGRWIKHYLSENLYSDFIDLYPTKGYISIWEHLFEMGPFIDKIAKELSVFLGYSYDESRGHAVTQFLHRINSLPNNATDFNV